MESKDNQIAEEAADWLLQLEEDSEVPRHADFVAWLKRSPRHMDEFLMVEASYRTVQQFFPRDHAVLNSLTQGALAEVLPLRQGQHLSSDTALATRARLGWAKNRRWFIAAAATIATIAAGLATFAPSIFHSQYYATAVGEQRAFKLPDGSLLNLNTQSEVEIDFSKNSREVRLARGEALFTVKQDSTRPFRVSTDTAVVQAIGTSFNVYRRPDKSTFVSVVEGRVNVTAQRNNGMPAANAITLLPLIAGEEAKISKVSGIERRVAPDVSQTVSWRQRRLVFRSTELKEVVAQFNRYNTDVQLHASGDGIAQRRITGTFNADEPRAFVKFLAEDSSIQLEQKAGRVEIRIRD